MTRNSPAIDITLLGSFDVHVAGKALLFPYQKPKLLIAYLVTEARSVHRANLSTLLWPDRSVHHARQNLRQAIASLKRQFGETFDKLFASSRQSLEFIGHEYCTIDIELLKNAVIPSSGIKLHGAHAEGTPSLQSIYRGPYCMGLHVQDSNEFNDWLKIRRQEFHSLAVTLGRKLVDSYRHTQQEQQAIQSYMQLLTIEWNNELLINEFMKYLITQGRRSQAISLFNEYETRLRKENGIQPSSDLVALYESFAGSRNMRGNESTISH